MYIPKNGVRLVGKGSGKGRRLQGQSFSKDGKEKKKKKQNCDTRKQTGPLGKEIQK